MLARALFGAIILFNVFGLSATVVIDSASAEPLGKASVLDKNGAVIGICSDKGVLPRIDTDSYPVTIQYVGYEPVTLVKPHPGPIKMLELPYNLAEVEVVAKKLDVLQLQGYVREFSTLTTDKMQVLLFREKAVDFMVPPQDAKKFPGWLYPRVLSSRSYYHFTSPEGLDSVSNNFDSHFSWSDWVGIFKERDMPDIFSHIGHATDTIYGKFGPSEIWQKDSDRVNVYIDVLADNNAVSWAPRIARYLGAGNDFTGFSLKYQFHDVEGQKLNAENIASISYNIESCRSGRDMHRLSNREKPVYINTYAELYITDRRYLSMADARKVEKNPPTDEFAAFIAPDNAPALPPSITNLIRRVNTIDHDERRRSAEADRRYIAKPNKERFSIIGTVKKVIKLVETIVG